jgi:hypothetical protein
MAPSKGTTRQFVAVVAVDPLVVAVVVVVAAKWPSHPLTASGHEDDKGGASTTTTFWARAAAAVRLEKKGRWYSCGRVRSGEKQKKGPCVDDDDDEMAQFSLGVLLRLLLSSL